MEMNDKILQAIQEGLPGATAGELKKFIEQATKDSAELKTAKALLEQTVLREQELLRRKSEFDTAKSILETCDLNNRANETKARDLSLKEKDFQLAAKDQVINNMREFISLISKNPRAIEIMSHTENISQPCYNAGGQMVYPPNIMKDERKSTETIETKTPGEAKYINPDLE